MSSEEGVAAQRPPAVTQALETVSGGEGPGGPSPLMHWLESFRPQIEQVARGTLAPDRLFRLVATLLRQTPRLADCAPITLAGAMFQAAQLGLEPGVLGQCWFVPFQNAKTRQLEAQFIIGYRGFLTLLYRSPRVLGVRCRAVAEHDRFEVRFGTEERLLHEPSWEPNPGPDRAYYLIVDLKDAAYPYIGVMTRREVDEHRAASRSQNDGPWATHYREMALKTLIRAHWRWLPTTVAADLLDEEVITDVRS
jgi:recombination protein RecT